MLRKTTLAVAMTVLSFTFAAPAAQANDDGEVKYRKSVMKAVGGHMGAIAGIMKQETGNGAHLQVHADGLAALSALVGDLFPEGSDMGADTTALPVIWEKPEDFAKAVKAFQDSAKAFAAAAKSGDMAQVGAALGPLGESCKNCHENFREKKEEKK